MIGKMGTDKKLLGKQKKKFRLNFRYWKIIQGVSELLDELEKKILSYF